MLTRRYTKFEHPILRGTPARSAYLAAIPLQVDLGATAHANSRDRSVVPLLWQGGKQVHLAMVGVPARLHDGFQHAIGSAEIAVNLEQAWGMSIHQIRKG